MSILSALRPTELHISTNSQAAAARVERRSAIDQAIAQRDERKDAVAAAQHVAEQQEKLVRLLDSDPRELLKVGEDGYEAARKRLTTLRIQWGKTALSLSDYECEHDIPALRAERAAIDDADAQDEQQALRATFAAGYSDLYDGLRKLSARYAELVALGDEAGAKWPNDNVLRGFAPLPPGLLNRNGKRSITDYLGQMIALVDPKLLPEDDPIRQRIEYARANGDQIDTWFPGLIWSQG